MDSSRAIGRVRSIIRGVIERENHSPTLVAIFEDQINDSLQSLRAQFRTARDLGARSTIWPKMVTSYRDDPSDEDTVLPVWGPIRNEYGEILGLDFMPVTNSGDPRRPRVHLKWVSPEIE